MLCPSCQEPMIRGKTRHGDTAVLSVGTGKRIGNPAPYSIRVCPKCSTMTFILYNGQIVGEEVNPKKGFLVALFFVLALTLISVGILCS